MIRSHRVLLAVTLAALLLSATSVATWRSLAAPPARDCPSDLPESAAADLPPVPGGPGFVSETALAFRPVNASYLWNYMGGKFLYNPGEGDGYYSAPVSLPHGATVTKLVVWYFDIADEANLVVQLQRLDFLTQTSETMAEAVSAGWAGSPYYDYVEDSSVTFPVIDLQNSAYWVEAMLPEAGASMLGLVGFRIDYAYPGYMPLAEKDYSGD